MANIEKLLSGDLQKYRPIPFWSWNDKLEESGLLRQIGEMKDAGMGGFFMHARSGLTTEYLSGEWFRAVQVCMEEAERREMDAWCYDENGWPSGFAGMKLLGDEANWVHYLTCESKPEFDPGALAVYCLEGAHIRRLTAPRGGVTEYICLYDRTNSSVVDILNERVVADFIRETHEKYAERFPGRIGKLLAGFFTDEPQYFRWNTAYSPVILQKYKEEYGGELLDTLGALFIDCEESYETRFKYWRLMNKQFTLSFGKQIYDWCEAHGCKLTGHAVEESYLSAQMWCCAGVMPFYEYEHIPGCDWLGRSIGSEIMPRQVSSVAMQLGKKQVLTESFACTGWDVTPKELKRILEWQYVNGVNLLCPHLTPYSLRGSRKQDYPAFFAPCNPWFAHFKQFADYFTALGFLLAESVELADVAVIHPMHSAYLTYKRAEDYESIRPLEGRFISLVERLGAANIGHHYIDELLLEKHGRVEGDRLILGRRAYTRVVIPDMQGLDASTAALLREYIQNGGLLYLDGPCPRFVDGKSSDLSFLKPNISFTKLQSDAVSIDRTDTEIRSTFRTGPFGSFLYAANLSEKKEYAVRFHLKAKGAVLLDLQTKQRAPLPYGKQEDGVCVPLSFRPGQSYVIWLDDGAQPLPETAREAEEIRIPPKGDVAGMTENTLVLDKAQLSFDNVTFTGPLPVAGINALLLKARQNRTVFLRYSFEVKEIPDETYLEIENMNIRSLRVNGAESVLTEKGNIDPRFLRGDISGHLRKGMNTVLAELEYSQPEQVYRILFDTPDVTESLLNCLTYDTEIEAAYLRGNFAVSAESGYVTDQGNRSVAGDDFAVTRPPRTVELARINEQGYPFFAGHFTVDLTLQALQRTDYRLKLKGRFAAAQVEVNGRQAGTLLFEDECDIGPFLRIGENTLRITLSSGGRNLFGPHHLKDEPRYVSPGQFNLGGTWENGKSPLYSDEYSFVPFGIDEITLV